MEDKVFDLLEKMYIEMQEMKSTMATKQDIVETRQDIVSLENKMDTNHKALYDGYKQSIEWIMELSKKLEKLTDKVENHYIMVRYMLREGILPRLWL